MGYICSALCAWLYCVCFPAVWPSGPFASSWDVNEIKRVNYLSPCPSIKLLCKDASINNVGVTMSVYKVALQRVLLYYCLCTFFASSAFLSMGWLLSLFSFILFLSFFHSLPGGNQGYPFIVFSIFDVGVLYLASVDIVYRGANHKWWLSSILSHHM